MKIKTCVVGCMSTNCYLVINEETKETIVIDPGDQAEKMKELIQEKGLVPVGILLTHGHFDHIMAVPDLVNTYGIKVFAASPEDTLLSDDKLNSSAMIRRRFTLSADILLEDEEKLDLGGISFKTIYTPGHTSGGICYYIENEKVIFTGDTLFFESVGRTDFPTGDMRSLLHSIEQRLLVLPEEVKVYPGHGETTSIGHEKKNNPFIKEYLGD
jgi:hydroxyacylglutathione hydrolase